MLPAISKKHKNRYAKYCVGVISLTIPLMVNRYFPGNFRRRLLNRMEPIMPCENATSAVPLLMCFPGTK